MTKLIIATLTIPALVLTAGLLSTVASAQDADPAAVFEEFVDAVNDGDVDAALALFTEDATWTRGGRCPPGSCAGQAAIRAELEKDVADGHRLDIVDVEVTGSTLTASVELRTDVTRAQEGINRAIQTYTVDLEGEKISALLVVPDFTDPETAELRNRMLPTTGGGPGPSTDSALAVFLAAALAVFGTLLALGAIRMRTIGRRG